MIKACFVFLGLFFQVSLHAQNTSKLDLHLTRQLQESMTNNHYSLLVQGDPKEIKQLAEKYGGHVRYEYNRISSVSLPSSRVIDFSKNEAVEKIENTFGKGMFLMDTARFRNNIDSIHAGSLPLSASLKGKGVVVGIIDGGLYFQHGDFLNPLDSLSTRVRYIWDQDVNGNNAPLPYSYGNQWSWIDINTGNCTHVAPASDFGHGTCVAGIAAGNGVSVRNSPHQGLYTGVAPESEIVTVKIKTDENFLAHVADAVDYVFKKADALGKPCVINTSIGTYYGSHDGNDLASKVIESLLMERNGRSLVAAGGNGGNIKHHLGYNIPSDSAYTFFQYNNQQNEVYFDLWADTANFNQAQFTVGCNDTFGNDLGRLRYFTIPSDFNPAPGNGVLLNQNLFTSTDFLGQVSMQATLDDNRYHVEFLITPANTSHYWRLQTRGQGKFDLWSSSALIGTADMTSYLRTGDTANPKIFIQYANYRHPDSLKTIVSSWQCSDKVITVANYSNRSGYFDRDSVYRSMSDSPFYEIPGKRFETSSYGPTRDGRMKPDLAATGSTTIATGDANYIAALSFNAENRKKVSATKLHVRNGGTSMASPIVAGIAALYFEKNPNATYDEIKEVMICTAKRDNFTGTAPNYAYGNGKVNGFAALTRSAGCITFGAKDTACINYNALANVDSGGCITKVYGCLDTAADNYDITANVSNNNCIYNTGIKLTSQQQAFITVAPNPFSSQTVFTLNGFAFEQGEIKIVSELGLLVEEIKLIPGKSVYSLTNNNMAKGIYFFMMRSKGNPMQSGKLVVE